MCVTIEEIKQKYNKVSCIIHQRILQRNDYFIDFIIFSLTLIFRQLDYRTTLEWGWYGVARSGASLLLRVNMTRPCAIITSRSHDTLTVEILTVTHITKSVATRLLVCII